MMARHSGEISVKPEIVLLEQLVKDLADGRLRIPAFQRPFVWRPEQMLNLFDSIERGYPIGSLLVWETDLDIPSLSEVADLPVPHASRGRTTSYLLDGHQRLSTLFGSLQHRDDIHVPSSQRVWQWRIHRVLGERAEDDDSAGWFRHGCRNGEPPAHYLPMSAVLRTMDFLAYSRDLERATTDESKLSSLFDDAEQLAHQIKSYQIAVVRLQGGDLRHAVEVFSRLNSSGQSMSPDQMVSALTYDPEGDSLAERIADLREDLDSARSGQLPTLTIFRTILAIAGEIDVQTARWEALARRVEPNLTEAVDAAGRALSRAVEFLRETGVPLARLVPYQLQVLLSAVFFHHCETPTPDQSRELTRWFWGTSWSGFFAGANSTQVKDALQRMRAFAEGRSPAPWDAQRARPFPDRFDLRSARVRAFVLWELREFSDRRDPQGEEFDPIDILVRSDAKAYRHVVRKGSQSVPHPANRLILPTRQGISVRRALLDLDPAVRDGVLASHGIPPEALARLREGDDEGFISLRASALGDSERAFMRTLDIEPAEEASGEADIDTE
jgi:hypothetical protein